MESATEHEPGGEPTIAEQPRRFRRSSDRHVGGVAGGMARYVGIDPMFFRIAFIVLAFGSGLGVFVYVGAWFLIPGDDDVDPRPLALTSQVPALIAGFATLAIGSLALTSGVNVDLSIVVPLGMVALGAWVLNQRRDPDSAGVAFVGPNPGMAPAPPADPHVVPPPPATPPPPSAVATVFEGPIAATPVGSTTESVAPITSDAPPSGGSLSGGSLSDVPPPDPAGFGAAVGSADPAFPGGPTAPPASGGYGGGGTPLPPASGWAHIQPDGPEHYSGADEPQGPPIVSITMAAIVVVIGAILVVRNLGGVDIGASLFLGGVLTVLGLGIVVSAFTRRALVLFPIAFFVSFLLLFSPLLDATANGGLGTRNIRATADDLQSSYSIGAGELLLDFSDLELTEDRRVEVNVGAGYTEIRLPADLRVEVEATTRFGYLEVLGAVDEGVSNTLTVVGEPDDPQAGTLTLVPTVTFGYAEVRRG